MCVLILYVLFSRYLCVVSREYLVTQLNTLIGWLKYFFSSLWELRSTENEVSLGIHRTGGCGSIGFISILGKRESR